MASVASALHLPPSQNLQPIAGQLLLQLIHQPYIYSFSQITPNVSLYIKVGKHPRPIAILMSEHHKLYRPTHRATLGFANHHKSTDDEVHWAGGAFLIYDNLHIISTPVSVYVERE
jgi:hypothetical protein